MGVLYTFLYGMIAIFTFSYVADVFGLRGPDPDKPFDKKVEVALIALAAAWPLVLLVVAGLVLLAAVCAVVAYRKPIGLSAVRFLKGAIGIPRS